MAYTAHKDAEAMKEHFDSPELLDAKIDQLVGWIREAKHFTIFTGAGISTSAGISDFRGPQGVWTLKAQGKVSTTPYVPTTKAMPTACHMAIVELQNRNILKYLISQNCDGLHKRSGMHPDRISELHGNSNIEECETCGKQYLRDFAAHRIGRGHDHYTGRHCVVPDAKKGGDAVCNGRLLEYTIDFGQNLPEVPLARAYENAKKSDLCLVLGSSLTVTPAADMPKITGQRKGGRLVICNLQKTPLYGVAKLNIHGRCDAVMSAVMQKLGLPIPGFVLRRKINISHEWKVAPATAAASAPSIVGVQLKLWAVDVDEPTLPATMIKSATLTLGDSDAATPDHFKSTFTVNAKWAAGTAIPPDAGFNLEFFKHYNEPNLALRYPLAAPVAGVDSKAESKPVVSQYLMKFVPQTGEWTVEQVSGPAEAKWIHAASKAAAEKAAVSAAATASGDAKSAAVTAAVPVASAGAVATAASGTAAAKSAAVTAPPIDEKKDVTPPPTKFVVLHSTDATTVNLSSEEKQAVTPASSGGLAAGGLWGSFTACSDVKDQPVIVACGGLGTGRNSSANGAISVFDVNSASWRALPAPAKSATPYLSAARWGYSGTVVPAVANDTVWLIGGWDSSSQFADVHTYSVKTHQLKEARVTGSGMTPRAHHSAVAVGSSIIVFGGSVCVGGPYNYYNDAYSFTPSISTDGKASGVWAKIATSGTPPVARAQHSATVIHDPATGKPAAMIVFGGENGSTHFGGGSVYSLDLSTWKWSTLTHAARNSADGKSRVPIPADKTGLKSSPFKVMAARHTAAAFPASGGAASILVAGLTNRNDWMARLELTPSPKVVGGWTYEWCPLTPSTELPLGQTVCLTPTAHGVIGIGFGGQSADELRVNSSLMIAKLVV